MSITPSMKKLLANINNPEKAPREAKWIKEHADLSRDVYEIMVNNLNKVSKKTDELEQELHSRLSEMQEEKEWYQKVLSFYEECLEDK